MEKTLQQIQQENRKFILEAIHGCSYEEALKKELGVGCKVIDKMHLFFGELSPLEMTLVYGNAVDGEESDPLYFLHLRGNPCVSFSKQDIFNKDKFEIIGKPLTLSRVLLAFKNKEVKTFYGDEIIFNIAGSQFCKLSVEDEESYATTYTVYGICLWNLELETLEEQSEETQRKINELFND
jgi:hypothetical protein